MAVSYNKLWKLLVDKKKELFDENMFVDTLEYFFKEVDKQ